ncbi:ABC transporter substrate-binding protein [Mycoplasma sp. ES3157-GEN-MYC]|uniref:ABC transporter substrate-binding protein n=1 Tax=Mycoplasma miroungigenitalium TaxID=754515 RepID=A0A6M4JCA2_9MOLU|nr:ABC transporter substrate-binding protein [Mycoplasma miroungigenitalium]MBU4690591.1 ABC transporter substrate-binding protein [Mycoplasma miroungigenitalium]MBU4691858.1 ABC transporter substrate-binding protein [Mycoplasma miroungigenitalium]QJR43717.1 ABC transporter substrate-binding protein [Mycoplasma miroungigenitalium]
MKKNNLLIKSSLSITAMIAPLSVLSCANKKDYDLGLATDPINSLNYIKYPSVNRVLPSLVESPLKSGPNESIKRLANIPKINMGIYQTSEDGSFDKYLLDNPNPENSGRFYALDGFGSAPGTITTDQSEYLAVHGVQTPSNKFLSLNVLLNDGQSKWSNGDLVRADDYIDAMHYIFDLETGSQKVTTMLQRKFQSSSEIMQAQQEYIQKHAVAYKNPFAYPPLIKVNGEWVYDVFDPSYQPWSSQVEGDEKEVENIKKAALNLGFYSGRMYWNIDNKTVLGAIPYSPDFNFEKDETVLMLPNPEYSVNLHSDKELESIPQRIPTKVKKYLYFDPKQTPSKEFKDLLEQSRALKHKLGDIEFSDENTELYTEKVNKLYRNLLPNGQTTLDNEFIKKLKPKHYFTNRVLALDEFTLRIAYDEYQPTDINNAYHDISNIIIPINRRFVESIGGIREFGLKQSHFLTNGPFNIKDLVLGPQGFISLEKNKQYYSSSKTISNKIKIYFSNDPNINSAMYEDGYISASKIPPVLQWKYWADLKTRKYMKKSNGFGTIALAFNLDKETNSNSVVNDINLRNAIYYAIDRNDMLNIVGWSSSFPVITWTAFGQASSSYGDAVESGFDHDYMYTKYGSYPEDSSDKTNYLNQFIYQKAKQEAQDKKWGIPIPVQNYAHIDHISKSMRFETVNRTDKAYHLEVARAFLEEFKKSHPNEKQITLKFISNSTDEQKNAGLALKDFMAKAFGNYINIDIKNLPENVYEDWRTTGKYDLIYRNFDAFGSDIYSYIRVFLKPDEINSKQQKTTGFRNNPAGGWTYHDYFTKMGYSRDKNNKLVILDLQKAKEIENLKQRLRILGVQPKSPNVWDKIVDLSVMYNGENLNDYTKRHMKFFSAQYTDEERNEGWTEVNGFAVIAGFEKIVREAAPVIPLMEVDTYWEVSRVNGTESLFAYSLQYAYDVANRPSPDLPTLIK